VYSIDEIIRGVNATKQYPIEQIYYALTHLIKDKNEYLMDYHGRLGNLINRDNYYLFQPLEISDTNASVFERMNPVDYKQPSIDIPSNFKHSAVMVQLENNEPKETVSFHTIMDGLIAKRQNVFGKTMEIKGKSWHENLHFVLHELRSAYEISNADIEKHLFHHLLDTMPFSQKVVLLEHLDDIPEEDIRNYFNSRRVKKYVVLYDGETNTNKYMYSADSKWVERKKVVWDNALADDDIMLREFNTNFLPKMLLKENEWIGFMTQFKNDIVFKVKTPNEKGTYISNGNRDIAVKIINQFLQNQGYDNQYPETIVKRGSNFDKYELSVILEIIMRNQDTKRVFLNCEQFHEMNARK
jgi:hypothetical protein